MSDNNEATAGLPMFTGAPMHGYFCQMADLGPSVTMPPSSSPVDWEDGEPFELPATYEFAGEQRSVEDFFTETDTAALLVLQDGKVRHERYALTGGRDVAWLSMSVAKSFISALVGIALGDGSIRSLDDAMSDYFDVAPGSAYDGVPIRDVLQMSSGARWNEDYNDPESDIFRLSAALGGVGTFDEFVATAAPENKAGTVCRYNSTDTQALTSLVVNATGRSIPDYMHDKLLDPLGTTRSSHWMIDGAGRVAGAFGLNMTARDFAKLGELYRNHGQWNGKQLISADYVAESVNSTATHTELGEVWLSDHHIDLGYGYQWWLPSTDPDEFTAIGVYNQLIYVHPPTASVIVKLSANRAYGTSTGEHTNRDVENTAFLRGIARHLA
jgi:CubicO group peptidase (beta-lactamase class C family)